MGLEEAKRLLGASIRTCLTSVKDDVEHPSHYTSHPSGVECITITQHHNFCIGNVIKYCWRQGLKEGVSSISDLMKARQYLDFEIERLQNAQKADGCRNQQEQLQQGKDDSR
jgi:hypothetical protein